MKLQRYFALLFLLNCWLITFSQKQHVQFEHIGTNMGLSQSSAFAVFQDSRGFMWFGTNDGLNKYDGYKFTIYKYNAADENSLTNNNIHGIIEDSDGNLWVATFGGGLNKFDWKKEKFTRYRYNAKNPSGIGDDNISQVFEDSEGDLWIGTNGGLNRYDKKNNNFIRYVNDKNNPQSLSDNRVTTIVEDNRHNLWIGTRNGGLNLFDKKNKTFRRFQHDDKNDKSLSSNSELVLFVNSLNQLWVGTRGGGLNLFDREKEIFIHFKNDPNNSNSLPGDVINVINEDEQGNLWLGTENTGLSIFNIHRGVFSNYLQDDADNTSLTSNNIISLCRDDKGNMWAGTLSGGINFVSSDAKKFNHYRHTSSPNSLNINNVLSIFEDSKENLWVGTDGGGINLFDYKKGTFTPYKNDPLNKNSLSGNYVVAFFEDSDGDLWIGTWGGGLTVFNKEKNTFKNFKYDPLNPKGISSSNVMAFNEDADKNIWIGTYGGGICRYDKKSRTFTNYRHDQANNSTINYDEVNIIYKDRQGNLWVGTNGAGLDLLDTKTGSFTHYVHIEGKKSISNNNVYNVLEDAKGNLWIGTALGLNRMEAGTRQFTNYYIKEGLPSNAILGLLFDKNACLWISTFNGLSRFNPATKGFKNFDISDGLQSNEFKMNSCYKARSGKMYFGGTNGFNAFFPDSIQEKKYEPPLVFTGFEVFNSQVKIGEKVGNKILLKQSITETKELILSYDQSVFSFEFASLNYVFQNKKRYSYMLENFDKSWNDIGSKHSATYTNLDPGKYLFKVRGLNNEGMWSSTITSVMVTIMPPFWLTWWFRLMVVVAVVGTILAIYRFRVRNIKAQKAKLEQQVYEQTRQLLKSTKEEQKARQEAELANRGLEAKNKELEQFAYVASHDLQEPLRTTAGFAELIQEQYRGKLDKKADKYIDFILESTARMKVLINDLLDFSRIGTKVELKEIDCNAIVKIMLADLTAVIQETKAEIQYTQLPVIKGYPTEIKLLFQNLVINAIKFRKANVTPQIKISARETEGYWEFAVSDNGIGIEKKYSERIFDIFQRLHTRAEYEGSGIGLAHCKKIVELHKGEIWFNSQPSEGTTFYFTILKID